MNWRENETLEDAAARLLAGLVEREKRKASGRLQAPEQIADTSEMSLVAGAKGRGASAKLGGSATLPGHVATLVGYDGDRVATGHRPLLPMPGWNPPSHCLTGEVLYGEGRVSTGKLFDDDLSSVKMRRTSGSLMARIFAISKVSNPLWKRL